MNAPSSMITTATPIPTAMDSATSVASVQATVSNAHATTFAKYTHPKLLGATADVIATTLILGMILRTLAYVYRRKRCQTGPGMLRPLLHFWVCHAFCEICARIIAIWLMPLRASWVASIFRALLLSTFAFSSRRLLEIMYGIFAREALAPYESSADESLRGLRERFAEFREWGVAVADELVKLYSVGGVASIAAAFRGDDVPPQPTTIAPAQEPDLADKVRRSVVVCAKPEEPKAAYSDSRKLRESFRKRAAVARKQAETRP